MCVAHLVSCWFWPLCPWNVCSCVRVVDVNGRTLIVIILFKELAFVVLWGGWTQQNRLGAFLAHCNSVLSYSTRRHPKSTHLHQCTKPHSSRETHMSTPGACLLQDNSCVNCHAITAMMLGDGVVGHLAFCSANCIVFTVAQFDCRPCSCPSPCWWNAEQQDRVWSYSPQLTSHCNYQRWNCEKQGG